MNKRMKQLRRRNELFIWQGYRTDSINWDEYRGLVIAASSPEDAIHMFWKGCLYHEHTSLYSLTEEQILELLDDAQSNGAPIPKMWEKLLAKVKPNWQGCFGKWSWEKVGKSLPGDSAGIIMTDYHSG